MSYSSHSFLQYTPRGDDAVRSQCEGATFSHELVLASIWGLSSGDDCGLFDQVENGSEDKSEDDWKEDDWDSDSTLKELTLESFQFNW